MGLEYAKQSFSVADLTLVTSSYSDNIRSRKRHYYSYDQSDDDFALVEIYGAKAGSDFSTGFK